MGIMALITTMFLAFIPMIESSSRYFMYTFSNPFGPSSNVPYPLDVCVNYDIGFHRLRAVYHYAIFTCNANNDGITMTTYASDRDCASQGTEDSTYSLQSFQNPGDLHSFNCIGEDNYAEALVYQNDDTCCGTYTPSRVATGICYPNADGTRYLMSGCDAEGIGTTYSSNTADCNRDNATITEGNFNECKLFKTKPTHIYIRFNKCMDNGMAIAESRFCVSPPTKAPITDMPSHAPTTASPTDPTVSTSMAPSVIPSVMPSTMPSVAPAAAGSWMDGMNPIVIVLGGCLGVALLVVVGVHCYCKSKGKRSYKKEEGLMEAQHDVLERIALDDVLENEGEEEEEDENQQIIGTAEEIDIADVTPVPSD